MPLPVIQLESEIRLAGASMPVPCDVLHSPFKEVANSDVDVPDAEPETEPSSLPSARESLHSARESLPSARESLPSTRNSVSDDEAQSNNDGEDDSGSSSDSSSSSSSASGSSCGLDDGLDDGEVACLLELRDDAVASDNRLLPALTPLALRWPIECIHEESLNEDADAQVSSMTASQEMCFRTPSQQRCPRTPREEICSKTPHKERLAHIRVCGEEVCGEEVQPKENAMVKVMETKPDVAPKGSAEMVAMPREMLETKPHVAPKDYDEVMDTPAELIETEPHVASKDSAEMVAMPTELTEPEPHVSPKVSHEAAATHVELIETDPRVAPKDIAEVVAMPTELIEPEPHVAPKDSAEVVVTPREMLKTKAHVAPKDSDEVAATPVELIETEPHVEALNASAEVPFMLTELTETEPRVAPKDSTEVVAVSRDLFERMPHATPKDVDEVLPSVIEVAKTKPHITVRYEAAACVAKVEEALAKVEDTLDDDYFGKPEDEPTVFVIPMHQEPAPVTVASGGVFGGVFTPRTSSSKRSSHAPRGTQNTLRCHPQSSCRDNRSSFSCQKQSFFSCTCVEPQLEQDVESFHDTVFQEGLFDHLKSDESDETHGLNTKFINATKQVPWAERFQGLRG